MCEANVYLLKDGKEEMILEAVDRITPEGDTVVLESIYSERMRVKARIKEMALVSHRVVLEEK